jgi:chorismate mutase / prephenate dehydrogenase
MRETQARRARKRRSSSADDRRMDAYRRRVEDVDRQIVRLVGERVRLARTLGALKAKRGLPVRVYAVEAQVLERWNRQAGRVGVDLELARELALRLIAVSVQAQESQRTGAAGRLRHITVVGGRGRIGSWLARFFATQGHDVLVHDPAGPLPPFPSEPDLALAVREADVVAVATPLGSGREVLRRVLALRPRGLVFDVFSLKSHVQGLLRQAARQRLRVASVHPLFGPGVRTLAGRVVAVCDCGSARAAREAAGLFEPTALTVVRLPIEKHDAMMQYVLGLSHLVNVLFVHTLVRSGTRFAGLERLASTTFHKQARTAREVALESSELYYDIQHLNTHSRALYRLVASSLAEIHRAALASSPKRFQRIMAAGRAYFPPVVREILD